MCGQNTEDILYDENFHRAGLKLKCINGKIVGVNNPSPSYLSSPLSSLWISLPRWLTVTNIIIVTTKYQVMTQLDDSY